MVPSLYVFGTPVCIHWRGEGGKWHHEPVKGEKRLRGKACLLDILHRGKKKGSEGSYEAWIQFKGVKGIKHAQGKRNRGEESMRSPWVSLIDRTMNLIPRLRGCGGFRPKGGRTDGGRRRTWGKKRGKEEGNSGKAVPKSCCRGKKVRPLRRWFG